MPVSPCPSHEALLGLASGEDDPALQAHLEGCQRCRDAVTIAARLAQTSMPTPQPTAELALEAGMQIGRYFVEATVGSGVHGQVVRARDTVLHRPVALKIFKAELSAGVEARVHQLREAQSIARLGHPAIATVHEIVEHAGHSVIVMEWVEGVTLREWMRGPRPWPEVLAVLEKIAHGLAAAHEAGVVHGDLKPDNLLVRADGSVKIVDFGLSRAIDSQAVHGSIHAPGGEAFTDDLEATTASGARGGAGTPLYMTSGQLRGGAASPASDQHAFFVTAYEALSGSRPYAVGSLSELLAAHGRSVRPLEWRIPGELRRVVRRGLGGMGEGYPGMPAVAEALGAVRGRRLLRLASTMVLALSLVLAGLALVEHHLEGLRPLLPAAAVWGPGQRLALELAMGPGRAHTTLRILDERAGALTTLLRRADVSPAQQACADSALDELGLVARAITERPDLAVDLITGVVESRDCDDDAEVQRQFGGPDAQQRQTVARLRGQLTRADLWLRQRKEPEALALLAQVAAAASDPRLAWLRCDAELRAARTLANAQEPAAARAAYLRALDAAVLARDDKRRARAYVGMSYALGGTFGDARTAAVLADLAWAHIQTFPEAHDVRAQVARARGVAAMVGNDFDAGHRWLDLALAEARLAWEDGFMTNAYLTALARLDILDGHATMGEQLARQAVAQWRQTWGEGQTGEITVMSVLAGALGTQGRHRDTLPILRANLALAEGRLGARHGQTLQMRLELGTNLAILGQWQEVEDVVCGAVEALGQAERRESGSRLALVVLCAHARWRLGQSDAAEALLRDLPLEHENVMTLGMGRLLEARIAAAHGQSTAARRFLHQAEDTAASLICQGPSAGSPVPVIADGWEALGERGRAACWRAWFLLPLGQAVSRESCQLWVDELRDSPACAERR